MANVSINETFGTTWQSPTGVPLEGSPYSAFAYNKTTQTKFWGFVTALILFNDVFAGTNPTLVSLTNKGYLYQLSHPATSSSPAVVGASSPPPTHPVAITFPMTNQLFMLSISPASGTWDPVWKWPVIAAVVVISVVIAVLVFVMLIGFYKQMVRRLILSSAPFPHSLIPSPHQDTNAELQAAKRAVEAEKDRLCLLLERQLELISCFEQQGMAQEEGQSMTLRLAGFSRSATDIQTAVGEGPAPSFSFSLKSSNPQP